MPQYVLLWFRNTPVLLIALAALWAAATARAEADLSVEADGPGTATVGGAVAYAFKIANAGPEVAVEPQLVVSIPPDFSVTSTGSDGGSCEFEREDQTIVAIRCVFGSLEAGASANVDLAGTPLAVGDLVLSARALLAEDPFPGNDEAFRFTNVAAASADLGTFLTAPDPVLRGQPIAYRLTLANEGPETAPDFAASVQLPLEVGEPSGFTFPGGSLGCTRPGATLCGRSPSRPAMTCFYPGVAGPRSLTCESGEAYGAGQFNRANFSAPALASGTIVTTAALEPTTGVNDPDPGNDTATLATTVEPAADLALVVTAPGNAILGTTFPISSIVENTGPDAAADVTLNWTLPAGLSLVATSGASCSGATNPSCSLGSIAAGASRTVTATVRGDALGSLTAGATAGSSTADPDADDLADDATTTVTTTPVTGSELSLSGTLSTIDPYYGESVSFTFTAANQGPDPAASVTVTGTFPPGFRSSSLGLRGDAAGGSCSFTGNPSSGFSCQVPVLANGDAFDVRVGGRWEQTGSVSFSATASSPTPDRLPGNESATVPAAVRAANADLLVGAPTVSRVEVGDTIQYRFNLGNDGPESVPLVSGDLQLPTNVSTPPSFSFFGGFSSCTRPGATSCARSPFTVRPNVLCFFPGAAGPRSVTCEVEDGGGIGPSGGGGAFGTAFVRVTATGPGTATAVATVQPDPRVSDGNPANDVFVADTVVVNPGETDLSLEKTAPSEVVLGSEFEYDLRIRNEGPNDATGVTARDRLPARVALVSTSGASCSGTVDVTCAIGTLGPSASTTVTLRVRAEATGTVSNEASVTAVETDPVPANDRDAVDVTIREELSDLQVTASAPSSVEANRPFDVDLTVRNLGPDRTRDVRVTGSLPAGVTLAVGNADCFAVAGGFECFVGVLSNLQSDFLRLRLQASGAGARQIPIAVTQANPDPDGSNDSPIVSFSITTRPVTDLVGTLSAPDEVIEGEVLSWTFTARNDGPDRATAVGVNIVFPTALFDQESATSDRSPCTVRREGASFFGEPGTIVTCGRLDLDAGESWRISLSARALSSGQPRLYGITFNSGLQDDPDRDNDTDLVTVNVLPSASAQVPMPIGFGAVAAVLLLSSGAALRRRRARG